MGQNVDSKYPMILRTPQRKYESFTVKGNQKIESIKKLKNSPYSPKS